MLDLFKGAFPNNAKTLRPHQENAVALIRQSLGKGNQTAPGEIWKPVPGYEGYCEASSFGRVRSLPRAIEITRNGHPAKCTVGGKVLSLTADRGKNAYGRLQVKLVGASGPKTTLAHRVVASAFLGECPAGMQVAHNDGDPTNNAITNLRYATPLENTADKHLHGTMLKGEAIGTAKLNADSVKSIRRLRQEGRTATSIAAQFGVSIAQVSRICNGTRWVEGRT